MKLKEMKMTNHYTAYVLDDSARDALSERFPPKNAANTIRQLKGLGL